jgi:F-type H+-transporting ATPase subunit epsilon
MTLELVTLSGAKLSAEVYEVILPTADGAIAVYQQHMPLVTNVVPGVVSVRRNKGDSDERLEVFASNGGVAEITGKSVRILVDEADSADEIVEDEARAALERAEKLRNEAKSSVDLAKAQAMIDRQAVRLRVAEIHKHRAGRRPRM